MEENFIAQQMNSLLHLLFGTGMLKTLKQVRCGGLSSHHNTTKVVATIEVFGK